MALTDQPYIPLYADDWMNNNKLKQCSPGAHGLMITIMCIMHKENTYGKLLLKQKFKQTSKQNLKQTDMQILSFAAMLAKLCCFDLLEIQKFLTELIDEKVLIFDADFLICPRMVKDAVISQTRAKTGREGGNKTASKFAKAKPQAKTVANAGIENENEIEIEIGIETENINVNESVNENVIDLENKNTAPADFLKRNMSVELEAMRSNSGMSPDEFESCLTHWSVKVEEMGWDYSADLSMDLRRLSSAFQKWIPIGAKMNSKNLLSIQKKHKKT